MSWRRGSLGIAIIALIYARIAAIWAYEAWMEWALSWHHLFEAKLGDILVVGIFTLCSIVAILFSVILVIIATEEDK